MSISRVVIPSRIFQYIITIWDIVYREFSTLFSGHKIFFPYRAFLIHPVFNELKKKPPIRYSNKRNAKLSHFIQGGKPKDLEKDHIIEVIDHALSLLAPYDGYRLSYQEYVEQVPLAKKIYESPKLKKIIFISKGQMEIFDKYFQDNDLLKKSVVIPLPWADNTDKTKNIFDDSRNYLFISSNYKTKGVPIVLDAWNQYASINPNVTLTLVSHDIPDEIERRLHSSIKLIKEAPLPKDLKDKLYSTSDVAITVSLTDGIIPIEATSYGKPVIVLRMQHAEDFIDNDNGILIDTPINLYDEDYGIEWKTSDEYIEVIDRFYCEGKFEATIKGLKDAFIAFENVETLESFTKNAVEKYHKSYRIENRNKMLKELYDECYN